MDNSGEKGLNLDIKFYISSSANPPVTVMDYLQVLKLDSSDMEKKTKITSATSVASPSNPSLFFIYIGTSDGNLILYQVTKELTKEGKGTVFFKNPTKKNKIFLNHGKKPVEQICCYVDINRVMTMCGNKN